MAVAACVVRDAQGRVLMAQRRADQLSPLCWEIPGGKVEPGESPEQAAARELLEETGVVAEGLRPLLSHSHDFPTRRIQLSVFEAEGWHGAAQGREGQAIAWIDPRTPDVAPILPTNDRVLARLALPKRLLRVAPPASETRQWAQDQLALAASLGAEAILLEGAGLPVPQRRALGNRLNAVASRSPIRIWAHPAGTSFAPVFGTHQSRAATTSRDALRGVTASLARINTLRDFDVALIEIPRGSAMQNALAQLAALSARSAGAVYAVVPGAVAAEGLIHSAAIDGVCICESLGEEITC